MNERSLVECKRRARVHVRQRRLALTAAFVTSLLAGCTFLIPFDDASIDAGGDQNPLTKVDASIDAPDAPDAPDGRDASDAADARDANADAAYDGNFATLASCKAMPDGQYCGNNQIANYPGSKDDLVTCGGAKVVAVKACTHGTGCVRMPNPKPDECDECYKKADGFYCGRDMTGWAKDNANVRVQCQAGGTADTTICASCISNGDASRCP